MSDQQQAHGQDPDTAMRDRIRRNAADTIARESDRSARQSARRGDFIARLAEYFMRTCSVALLALCAIDLYQLARAQQHYSLSSIARAEAQDARLMLGMAALVEGGFGVVAFGFASVMARLRNMAPR